MNSAESYSPPLHLTGRLAATFEEYFEGEYQVALAPGRVNLVGEHTDYNDGFVLPMTIDRHMTVAFAPREDRSIFVHALDLDDKALIDLDDLHASPRGNWSRYVAGVAWAMQAEGAMLRGLNMMLHGDIPVGAGLSSSAALELVVMRALAEVSGVEWEAETMARLARRAENEFVGVACGIMDQFVVGVTEDVGALLLDCRSLEHELVAIPDDAVVYVLDTGVRRSLANSVYDERVRDCREAVERLREVREDIVSLRDISPELLERARPDLPEVIYRRAKHVVDETRRPSEMAGAFRENDLIAAGNVMMASHASLRDLYEVSSPELDFMVEYACAHDACYGSRLTGAGLGGCAIALVDRDGHDDFAEWISTSYRQRYDHPSAFYACRPATGVHLL